MEFSNNPHFYINITLACDIKSTKNLTFSIKFQARKLRVIKLPSKNAHPQKKSFFFFFFGQGGGWKGLLVILFCFSFYFCAINPC